MTTKIEITAYHEAGHVIMSRMMGWKTKSATIVPDPTQNYLGQIIHAEGPRNKAAKRFSVDQFAKDFENGYIPRIMDASLVISLAGWISELILTGEDNKKSYEREKDTDIKRVEQIAYGFFPEEVAEAYLGYMFLRTRAMLKIEWYLVQAVANELLVQKTLSSRKLNAIIHHAIISRGNKTIGDT